MSAYSVRVTAPAAFPAATAPSVVIPFEPRRVLILNEDGTPANYVEWSFDAGDNVHGRLTPGTNASYESTQHGTRIWLRRGAGTPSVQVIAEDTLR
jgi:hypothetical protein